MAAKEKNVETISASIIPLKKKNVGDNAKNIDAKTAVFLSNTFFPITYVNRMHKLPKTISAILPNRTTSKPIFQRNPKINGHTMGLEFSHKPALPR